MTRIAFAAAVLALIGVTGWGWAQYQAATTWEARAELRAAQLAICTAQQRNITEDRKSDQQIDALPADGLRRVPDRWMRPDGEVPAGR